MHLELGKEIAEHLDTLTELHTDREQGVHLLGVAIPVQLAGVTFLPLKEVTDNVSVGGQLNFKVGAGTALTKSTALVPGGRSKGIMAELGQRVEAQMARTDLGRFGAAPTFLKPSKHLLKLE